MSTIVLRQTKGSALTFAEGDTNFSNLNNDKLEDITGESIGDLSDVDLTGNANGYVLTYNSATGKIEPQQAPAGGISSVSADTNPSLGGNLAGSNFVISNIKLEDYEEIVYDLGTVSNTQTINLANGNVQKYTNDGFTFGGFTSPAEGQAVTLISKTGSDMSGMFNIDASVTSKKFGNEGSDSISMTGDNLINIAYIDNTYYISIAKGYM